MQVFCWNNCIFMTLMLVQVFILTNASEVTGTSPPSNQTTMSSNLQASFSIVTSPFEVDLSTAATTTLQVPMSSTVTLISTQINSTNMMSSTVTKVIRSVETDSLTSRPSSSTSAIHVPSSSILSPTSVSSDTYTTHTGAATSVRSSESQLEYQTTQLSNVSHMVRTVTTESVSISPTSTETHSISTAESDATTPISHFSTSSTSHQTTANTIPSSSKDTQIHSHSSTSVNIFATPVLTETINTDTTLSKSSTETTRMPETSSVIDEITASGSVSSSENESTQGYLQNATNTSSSLPPLTDTTLSVTVSVDRSSPSSLSSGVTSSMTSSKIAEPVSTQYNSMTSSENEQSSLVHSSTRIVTTSSYELPISLGESSTRPLESQPSSSLISRTPTMSVPSSSSHLSMDNNTRTSTRLDMYSTSTSTTSASSSSDSDVVTSTSTLEHHSSAESVASTTVPFSIILPGSSSESIFHSSSTKPLLRSIILTSSSETIYSSPFTSTRHFVSSSANPVPTMTVLYETSTSVPISSRPSVSQTPPLHTVIDHAIVSPSVTVPETTERTDMSVSITTALSSSISTPISSNIPQNETELSKGTLTRALITFDGNCHILKHSVVIQREFLKAWANEVEMNTGLSIDTDGMEIEDILCDPFRVILHMFVNDTALFSSVRSDNVWTNFNVKIPDSLRELNFSLKRLQILDDESKDIDEWGDVSVVGHLEVTDLVIIGVASFLFLVLVTMLIIVLCRECYIRKRSSSFSLTDIPHINLKLSDFTLTKIPRPQVIYRENSKRKPDRVPVTRVDPISRNVNRPEVEGHYEKLHGSSDKNQMRISEHAYGLVVGVMGNKQENGSPNESMISSKGEDSSKKSLLTKEDEYSINLGINNPTFSTNDEEVNGNSKYTLKEEEIEHFL